MAEDVATRDWEAEIRSCQQQWMEAVRKRDHAALERIIAEEFELVSATTGFVDRPRYFREIDEYELEEFEYLESKINLHGDWAISHSRYSQKASHQGRPLHADYYLSDVWVFRDGRWQVIVRHSSVPVERHARPA
jgi:ketosteroid isomerase-like protein